MRKIFLLLLICIGSYNFSFGQTISISDAIDHFNCNSFNCINDYLSNKKFGYLKYDSVSNKELIYLFKSRKPFEISDDNNYNYNHLTVHIENGNFISEIGIATFENNYYNALVEELGKLEFISIDSESKNDNWVYTNYQSTLYPNYSIMLQVGPSEKKNITNYVIKISIKK